MRLLCYAAAASGRRSPVAFVPVFCLGPQSSCCCGLADDYSIAAEQEVSVIVRWSCGGRGEDGCSHLAGQQSHQWWNTSWPPGVRSLDELQFDTTGSNQSVNTLELLVLHEHQPLVSKQSQMEPNGVSVVHREGSSQLVTSVFHLCRFSCLWNDHTPHTVITAHTLTGVGSNSVYCWFELEETKKIKWSL